MKLTINETNFVGQVTIELSDFKDYDEMVDEMVNFYDRSGTTVENITDYLTVFSTEKYEIYWAKEDMFTSTINDEDIQINFLVKKS